MAQNVFQPRPPHKPTLNAEAVTPPPPLEQPDETKAPILQRILPLVMIVMMGGMIAVLVIMSPGGLNPMMMMAPVMMVAMFMGMLGGMGGGGNTLANDRMNHFLHLREERKKVHKQGEGMFQAQAMSFPQPQLLPTLVGTNKPSTPGMWTIRFDDQGGFAVGEGSENARDYRPYLAARVGRGAVLLEPEIRAEELPVSEHLEPVTLGAYRRFLRIQRFVAGFPIGYKLADRPFHSITGPDDRVLPLVRAMIASLAFNHAPDQLQFVVVTDNPDSSQWGLMKWLPHVQDTDRMTSTGSWRYIYTSMRECGQDLAELFARRGPRARRGAIPHIVILVDLPDSEVRLPEGVGSQGISGVTFLVVRAKENKLPDDPDATLHVDDNGKLSTNSEEELATADSMDVHDFERFVRAMAAYRPPNTGELTTAPASTEKTRGLSYLEALGIDDLELFDPRIAWAANDSDPQLTLPLGNVIDEQTGQPTGEITELDMAESSIGGTGPNGVLQGKTGTGKSFILRGGVLALCSKYGPERLNFILMDFKGGATFIGFEQLPHVLANITNLASEAELLDRAFDVIEGEILRREELISKIAKVENFLEYRKLQATKRPDLPALPALFIIADEFREFMTSNRQYMKLFESIAQVGRALGFHLLAASQFIDSTVVGTIENNLTFGISLKVDRAVYSNSVIKSDAATHLPIGDGSAYLWRDVGEPTLTRFRGFDIKAPYLPALARAAAGRSASSRGRHHDSSALELFTATNTQLSQRELDPVESQPDEPDSDDIVTVRDALIARLTTFQELQPRQLWLPTLKAPFSFHGSGYPELNQPALSIDIGELDDPRNHRRVPYIIRPEGSSAHIRIIGDPSSGRSTTIETIIAATAIAYTPAAASFYVVDCGSKLQEIKDYPNVGAYARRPDTELIDRILGEFIRINEIRNDEFGKRSVSSYQAYASTKAAAPVAGDPYGHIFLVVDDIHSFLSEDPRDGQRLAQLMRIGLSGGPHGIHLIASGGPQSAQYKLDPMFGYKIHQHVGDITQLGCVAAPSDVKNVLKKIPAGQPGRVVETSTMLHGRIRVPQAEPIAPIETTIHGEPEYDLTADYSTNIRHLGAVLSQRYGQEHAPHLVTVPSVLSYQTVWDLYASHRRADDRSLPIGASAEDLTLVSLTGSSHLVVAGDRGSGKTNVIRSLMYSIMQQYTPETARIYLIDPEYGLLDDRDVLDHVGMLAAYAADKPSATAALTEVAAEIRRRQPEDASKLDARIIRDRSWYTGPEIFVLIDPVTSLFGASAWGSDQGPVDVLNEVIALPHDVGLHVFVTTPSNGFTMVKEQRGLFKAITSTNPCTLLLSGTGNDNVFGSATTGNAIKFARRRPGLGQLHNPNADHNPLVQTALLPDWPTADGR